YLNHLRPIAGKLYICGFHGQVYRQNGKDWIHLDRGLVEQPGPTANVDLTSIDGSSEDNLFTVGMRGQVFRFNGQEWKQIGSPTNQYLSWVRCISENELFVCGRKGTFFRFEGGRWEDLSLPRGDDFWCIEKFQEDIYVSSLESIFILKNNKL